MTKTSGNPYLISWKNTTERYVYSKKRSPAGHVEDIVMVLPDMLCGIEIKSDADSYQRLKNPVRDYDLYYDMNIIAVGTSHALHVMEHVPDYWGVITVEELETGPDLYFYRKPAQNPKMKIDRKIEARTGPYPAAQQNAEIC